MLSTEEKSFVIKYVDDAFYNQEKLIKYLCAHDVVGMEIFPYCDRKNTSMGEHTYSRWLEYDDCYSPMPVSQFIKRIPFFFYTTKLNSDIEEYGDLETLHHCYGKDFNNKDKFESIYTALEYMFYNLNLPLNKIFSYWINQTGQVNGNLFFQWEHYLHLCADLKSNDYFPENFIVAYNRALESSNLPPIIYEIQDTGIYEPFVRVGNKLTFEGIFPCDEQGHPIMRWIGLKIENAKAISCSSSKSRVGRLTVEINPNTVISALNYYNNPNDTDDVWYQIYTGPLIMQFNHEAIKYHRKRQGYTQQFVADAVGTSVRTYQKWESGNSTPDGYYLIRLLNWLDISDIQDIIKYAEL